jgi:hypothetical protein
MSGEWRPRNEYGHLSGCTVVEVELRDLSRDTGRAGEFDWSIDDAAPLSCDIIRFRVLEDAPASDALSATLDERGKRYGVFTGHASITQRLKETMRATKNWPRLADDQKEALEMVAHKIGRVLNGDPDYDDSWVDIAGYTRLVADRLQGVSR